MLKITISNLHVECSGGDVRDVTSIMAESVRIVRNLIDGAFADLDDKPKPGEATIVLRTSASPPPPPTTPVPIEPKEPPARTSDRAARGGVQPTVYLARVTRPDERLTYQQMADAIGCRKQQLYTAACVARKKGRDVIVVGDASVRILGTGIEPVVPPAAEPAPVPAAKQNFDARPRHVGDEALPINPTRHVAAESEPVTGTGWKPATVN